MTKAVTLIFPGQGSQYVGMGQPYSDEFKYYLDLADKNLGYSLTSIIKNGPEEELKLTHNTQPAIVTYSTFLYQKLLPILNQKNIKIERVLGHSVGEFSALVAANSISFENAIKTVHYRGKFMQESVPSGTGKMFAIMKVPADIVQKACTTVSSEYENVMPANFNGPNQIVISGHSKACENAVEWIKNNFSGSHRAIELKVSAPFHSSLMKNAADKLNNYLNKIEIRENLYPYIANVDAKEYLKGTSSNVIQNNLFTQVAGSVLWEQSFNLLEDNTTCIEVGPGKILAGLSKKINSSINVISLDNEESWNQIKDL